jgi:hypothetical protein
MSTREIAQEVAEQVCKRLPFPHGTTLPVTAVADIINAALTKAIGDERDRVEKIVEGKRAQRVRDITPDHKPTHDYAWQLLGDILTAIRRESRLTGY